MRITLSIIVGLTVFHAQPASAYLFGETPVSKEAVALQEKVAGTFQSQGIAPAIRMLDEEGGAFLKRAEAAARYDFFDALQTESKSGGGRDNQEWLLALTEWCYRYCVNDGESYWASIWIPLMHERYFDAGKYGAARAVIDRERCRLLEEGKELEVESMQTLRPANPEFPAVGLKTLGSRERFTMKEYPLFMSHAMQNMVEGHWRRAMESAVLASDTQMRELKWYQQRPNLTDSKVNVVEKTGKWRKSQLLLSEGYRFLDLPEPELDTLREMLKFNSSEQFGRDIVLIGGCRVLHLESILGLKGIEALAEMVKMRDELAANPNVPVSESMSLTLLIADVHFRKGDAKNGWQIIDEMRMKSGLTRDMRFEVDSEWSRHRVDTSAYEGVENVLISLLKIAREGGLKQREIGLYEVYAKLLIGLGRYEDALVIQRELLRLLRSFDLFPRIPAALRQLAAIHALIGERDLADVNLKEANRLLEEAKLPDDSKIRLRTILAQPLPESVRKKPVAANSDLQPMRSIMIPLEGLPARGLFTLTNHSGNEVAGELRFKGAGLVFRDEAAVSMVGVDVAIQGGGTEISSKVTIPAGDFLAIDLSRNPALNAARETVAITWQPVGGKPQTAEWIADTAEGGVTLAVTDAGDYMDNPFYLIPVYHLLQYKDAFAKVADVRVVASKPARIELYDQDDELVLVDADGDGAFTTEGDMISKDLNRNGAGDFVLDASAKEKRFRLFVRPAEVVAGDEISLDLQLYQQGEWVTHSTDRIVFPEKGK